MARIAVNVSGGTNAGWRNTSEPEYWTCEVCGERTNKYACPNACGTRRPEPEAASWAEECPDGWTWDES